MSSSSAQPAWQASALSEQAPFYIFTAFVFAYGVGTLKVSRDLLLTAVLAASVVSFFSIAVYISICAVISVVAAALMQDYTGKDISAEYAFGED